jgi:hypothetical protein
MDPMRLHVAAHELGHWAVWTDAGLVVKEIRVLGRGAQTEGWVTVTVPPAPAREQARLYLVGLAAGRAASLRWCEEQGLAFTERGCREDEKQFRRDRQALGLTSLTRGQARAEAARLVRAKWRQICQRAPLLARAGTISV